VHWFVYTIRRNTETERYDLGYTDPNSLAVEHGHYAVEIDMTRGLQLVWNRGILRRGRSSVSRLNDGDASRSTFLSAHDSRGRSNAGSRYPRTSTDMSVVSGPIGACGLPSS
jgi:hypothetical protein